MAPFNSPEGPGPCPPSPAAAMAPPQAPCAAPYAAERADVGTLAGGASLVPGEAARPAASSNASARCLVVASPASSRARDAARG